MVATDLPEAWSAAHGGGTHGTFRVDRLECTRGCHSVGTFTSDDRTVTLTDARLTVTAPFGWEQQNTVVRATWQGERNPVIIYREKGSIDWIWAVAICTLGLVSAMWLLLCAVDACLRIREHKQT